MDRIVKPPNYEPKIDTLNRVGSLLITDKVIAGPDFAICDKQGTEKDSGVEGRFLRCDERGNMLRKNVLSPMTEVEEITEVLTGPDWMGDITPITPARWVSIYWTFTGDVASMYLKTPLGDDIDILDELEYTQYRFPPAIIHLECRGIAITSVFVRLLFLS